MPHNTPEKRLAYRRRPENVAKNRAHSKAWRAAHPLNIADKASNVHFYLRAIWYGVRKRNMGHTLTQANLLTVWKKQGGRCAITNIPMTHSRLNPDHYGTNGSVDRIDNERGYTLDNIRFVCRRINSMRGEYSDEELVKWCLLVVRNLGR